MSFRWDNLVAFLILGLSVVWMLGQGGVIRWVCGQLAEYLLQRGQIGHAMKLKRWARSL